MKKLTKNIFLLATSLLILAVTINAQHQMNHAQKDTTNKMHHMITDSTKMNHKMMNDTTKMHHKMHKIDLTPESDKMIIWNAYCPVKGGEVDPEAPTVQYKGKTIGFCCPGCDSKFMAEPEKYMKNLSEDGKKFIGDK